MTDTVNTTDLLLLPKYDYVFKCIFGDPKHTSILINFLNSIVQCKTPITKVKIENIEMFPEALGDKWSYLDVLATTQDGEIINIEIQLNNKGNTIPRTLFYWSKLFARQLLSGENYNNLKRTVTITILDFNLFKQDKDGRYWHQCRLTDQEDHCLISPLLEIHFLELHKMQALRPNSTVLETWLEFLRNPRSQEMLELAKTRPEIAKAQDILMRVNNDPEARELWRKREKAIYDESSALAYAKNEGKVETAKNLKAMGMITDVIQKATGLSTEEIANA
jgi:predicted transposase/invertase (TIGR01784 family)